MRFVKLPHMVEDLGGDLDLARAGRLPLDGEAEGLTEANCRFWEAQPLPLARPLRAFDRDGDDRGAGFEGDAADAWFGLAQLLGAGAASLSVDEEHFALVEQLASGLEGLLVVVAAADGEDAAVLIDVGQDWGAEELGFGHEADLPAQVEADEEVVHLAE